MQCSPNRTELATPRRKSRLAVHQQDNRTPSPCFIDLEFSSHSSSRNRRTLVSQTAGTLLWSPPLPLDVHSHATRWSPKSNQLLSGGVALLDVSSFPCPELLVAPDDDEEAMREARRRDMLKDDMLMFYREIYKLQMKDCADTSPSSVPHGGGGLVAHEEVDINTEFLEEEVHDDDDGHINQDHDEETWEKKLDDQRDQRMRLCSGERTLTR
jgi:hypothetical protein